MYSIGDATGDVLGQGQRQGGGMERKEAAASADQDDQDEPCETSNSEIGTCEVAEPQQPPPPPPPIVKTYTEELSYFHLFRNYDRLWSLILFMFYLSVVIAGCSGRWECSAIDYSAVLIPLTASMLLQELVSLLVLGIPISRRSFADDTAVLAVADKTAPPVVPGTASTGKDVTDTCTEQDVRAAENVGKATKSTSKHPENADSASVVRFAWLWSALKVVHQRHQHAVLRCVVKALVLAGYVALYVYRVFTPFLVLTALHFTLLAAYETSFFYAPLRKYMTAFPALFLSTAACDGPFELKPPTADVTFYNVLLWTIVLGLQFCFGLFVLVIPLTRLGYVLVDKIHAVDQGEMINFITFSIPFQDVRGMRVMIPLWIIVFILYIVGLEVWYVLVATLSSSVIGINRRIHEKTLMTINHETIRSLISIWGDLTCDVDEEDEDDGEGILLSDMLSSGKVNSKPSVESFHDEEESEGENEEEYEQRFVFNMAGVDMNPEVEAVDGMPVLSLGNSNKTWRDSLNKGMLNTLRFALLWNDMIDSMYQEDNIDKHGRDTLEFLMFTVPSLTKFIPSSDDPGEPRDAGEEESKEPPSSAQNNDELTNDLVVLNPAALAKGGFGEVLATISASAVITEKFTKPVQTGRERRATSLSAMPHSNRRASLKSSSSSESLDAGDAKKRLTDPDIQCRILWDQIFSEKKFEHAAIDQVVLILVSFFAIVLPDEEYNVSSCIYEIYQFVLHRCNNKAKMEAIADMFELSVLPELCAAITCLLQVAANVDQLGHEEAQKSLDNVFVLLDKALIAPTDQDIANGPIRDAIGKIKAVAKSFVLVAERPSWKRWENARKYRIYLTKLYRHYHTYITCDVSGALPEEVQRRLEFYVNSIFHMEDLNKKSKAGDDETLATKSTASVRVAPAWKRAAFATLTPYYDEDIILGILQLYRTKLNTKDEHSVCILKYLRSLYGDDWDNFMNRVCGTDFLKKQAEQIMQLLVEAVDKMHTEGSVTAETEETIIAGVLEGFK
jgi:hypothetical protein